LLASIIGFTVSLMESFLEDSPFFVARAPFGFMLIVVSFL